MFCANLGASLGTGLSSSTYWVDTIVSTATTKVLTGGGVAVDSLGNIVTVGATNFPSYAGGGAFVTKVDKLGAKVWQTKITTTAIQAGLYASPLAIDSAGNVIVALCDPGGYYYVFKLSSAGVLVWQRRNSTVASLFGYVSLVLDSSDNIELLCDIGGLTKLISISSAGAITQQSGYGDSASDLLYLALTYAGASRIIAGQYRTGIPTVVALNSTGAVVWANTFTTVRSGAIYGLAVDGDNNIYAVGGLLNAALSLTQPIALKYSSAGVLQWQKILTVPSDMRFTDCSTDTVGDMYAIASSSNNLDGQYALIVKISSAGALLWQTKVSCKLDQYGRNSVRLWYIAKKITSVLSISGSAVTTGSLQNVNTYQTTEQYIHSVPTSAGVVGVYGIHTYETSAFTLSNIGLPTTTIAPVVTTPTVSLATPTLVTATSAGTATPDYIAGYVGKYALTTGEVTSSFSNTYSLVTVSTAVDNLDNVYSVAYPYYLANSYAVITKVAATGQLLWQRLFDTTLLGGGASLGLRLVLNSSQTTLYVYIPAAVIAIAAYSSAGALIAQKTIPRDGGGNQRGALIGIDSSDNLYIASRISAGSPYPVVTKLSSSLALVFSITVPSGTMQTTNYCVTADSAGNIYLCGVDVSNSQYLLGRVNASGTTVAWQRYIKDATNSYVVNALSVSAAGNLYVSGIDSGGDRATIGKFSTGTGAIIWQKRISGLATIQGVAAIAIDSAENCYVLTYSFTTVYFAALFKFDSTGNLLWQRKISLVSASNWGVSTVRVTSTGVIVSGWRVSSVSGITSFDLAFKADGTGTGTWGSVLFSTTTSDGGITYAVSTYTVAAITPISTVPTALTVTNDPLTLTTTTAASTAGAGAIIQLNEIV